MILVVHLSRAEGRFCVCTGKSCLYGKKLSVREKVVGPFLPGHAAITS